MINSFLQHQFTLNIISWLLTCRVDGWLLGLKEKISGRRGFWGEEGHTWTHTLTIQLLLTVVITFSLIATIFYGTLQSCLSSVDHGVPPGSILVPLAKVLGDSFSFHYCFSSAYIQSIIFTNSPDSQSPPLPVTTKSAIWWSPSVV